MATPKKMRYVVVAAAEDLRPCVTITAAKLHYWFDEMTQGTAYGVEVRTLEQTSRYFAHAAVLHRDRHGVERPRILIFPNRGQAEVWMKALLDPGDGKKENRGLENAMRQAPPW